VRNIVFVDDFFGRLRVVDVIQRVKSPWPRAFLYFAAEPPAPQFHNDASGLVHGLSDLLVAQRDVCICGTVSS
jgi:hypothetical protein